MKQLDSKSECNKNFIDQIHRCSLHGGNASQEKLVAKYFSWPGPPFTAVPRSDRPDHISGVNDSPIDCGGTTPKIQLENKS